MFTPPLFSQRDPRWGNKKLGTSATTIKDFGCLLTCLAMMAKYYGKGTDPDLLNQSLIAINGYASGNLYKWYEGISKIYPDITLTALKDTPNNLTKREWDLFDAQIVAGKPIIVQVDFYPATANPDMHFVVIISGSQGEYQIYDPYYGDIASLRRYGDPKTTILKYVFHDGKVPTTPVVTVLSDEGHRALAFVESKAKVSDNIESLVREWWEIATIKYQNLKIEHEKLVETSNELIQVNKGQKDALKVWSDWLDDIWMKLDPIGKTKSLQSVSAEIAEMLEKEIQDKDCQKRYETLEDKYSALFGKVKEIANSSSDDVDTVLSNLQKKEEVIVEKPVVVKPPSVPKSTNWFIKLLEGLLK